MAEYFTDQVRPIGPLLPKTTGSGHPLSKLDLD